MRGRGLKPGYTRHKMSKLLSPPVRGARIETTTIRSWKNSATSPPVRGRGLKLPQIDLVIKRLERRPPCGGAD